MLFRRTRDDASAKRTLASTSTGGFIAQLPSRGSPLLVRCPCLSVPSYAVYLLVILLGRRTPTGRFDLWQMVLRVSRYALHLLRLDYTDYSMGINDDKVMITATANVTMVGDGELQYCTMAAARVSMQRVVRHGRNTILPVLCSRSRLPYTV